MLVLAGWAGTVPLIASYISGCFTFLIKIARRRNYIRGFKQPRYQGLGCGGYCAKLFETRQAPKFPKWVWALGHWVPEPKSVELPVFVGDITSN